ncbi:MAG TPA: glycosyltransferase family 2 protein [Bacteroidales bacterium]|nr:glycosyltransferase family 2 protein [Bacteroidales bacterium]HNW74367.1 glycosyltransferase family 2 protein [Bacteroidales bacterium]
MNKPQINIIVPLFNEEKVFDELAGRLQRLMDRIPYSIEVIMVDDGSTDRTPEMMRQLCLDNEKFQALILSRNFGHQYALTAGLKYSNATDAVMIIDGDLQDPPELLETLYDQYKMGYDVVYAIRTKRKESFVKRIAYKGFYRLLQKSSYIEIPVDSGDFCLMSSRVVKSINQMPEGSRFLRGMRSWVGFRQVGVEYEREKRIDGESKYSVAKMLRFAVNGIFNFSEYPIRLISVMGLITIVISIGYFLYVLYAKLMYGDVPPGFTALLFMVILFGGIQLLAIGLIGEYVLRIFFQVKNRPLFLIKERIANKKRCDLL